MRPFWQKPVFWIISSLLSMALMLLFTYLFKDSILSILSSSSTSKSQSPVQTSTPGPVVLDIKLACPVPQEFCVKGENREGYQFLGFDLPPQIPVLAVFSGMLRKDPQRPDKPGVPRQLFLRDSQGHEANYAFFGEILVPSGTQVSVGQKIGRIGEGHYPALAPFTGFNFLFSLNRNKERIPLDPQDFVK